MHRTNSAIRVILTALIAAQGPAQEVSQSGLRLKAERPMVNEAERAPHGMVASASSLASQVGIEVLKSGGNAIDAAVAVGFALAVVHPEAGNLGGGGYMLVRMADGRSKVIDYKETAPALAKPGLYQEANEAHIGYKASAVPGTVAGLSLAHQMFGTKTWRDLIEPARRLAKDGFPASQRMELILALQVPVMKAFPETSRVFLHGGTEPLKQGEIVKQPDLAETIARIQKYGWREFYEGETARRIAADMQAHAGTIGYDDLKGYKAIAKDPLQGSYRGHPILTVTPSSRGGFTLLEMLNIVENFPMKLGMEGSSQSLHIEVEAMRRAYRDSEVYAADPAFFPVPLGLLTSKNRAHEWASKIRAESATPSAELDAAAPAESSNESAQTTHFSIVDNDGNLVTNTYTLNGFYGSQVMPKGTGVLLNDIMSGFSSHPGARNEIGPGKRPVSSMTPTIVLRADGRPWFALGSPGSATIPNTVLEVILNVIDFKMSLRDAVEFPRIHHQFRPDRIDAEPGALIWDVAEKLKQQGYNINPGFRSQGDVHAVMIEEGGWKTGWSDGRRGGHAIGY